MKRDLELVRRILLHLEEGEASPSGFGAFVEDGYGLPAIHYHIRLLHDAGLIEADEIVPGQWWPERMTWSGHEFLDAARNEDLWRDTKKKVEKSTGTAPFLVFHELLLNGLRARVDKASRSRSKGVRARPRARRH